MSLQRIIINSTGTAADFDAGCPLSMGGEDACTNVGQYFDGLASGATLGALVDINVGMTQATATLTVATGGSTNGQAGSLLNTALSAVTSGADPTLGQFNISATAATQAASMVIAINTVLAGKVLATNALGVITITALVPGVIGNGLQISAGNLANVTAGAFANGADGTAYELDFI